MGAQPSRRAGDGGECSTRRRSISIFNLRIFKNAKGRKSKQRARGIDEEMQKSSSISSSGNTPISYAKDDPSSPHYDQTEETGAHRGKSRGRRHSPSMPPPHCQGLDPAIWPQSHTKTPPIVYPRSVAPIRVQPHAYSNQDPRPGNQETEIARYRPWHPDDSRETKAFATEEDGLKARPGQRRTDTNRHHHRSTQRHHEPVPPPLQPAPDQQVIESQLSPSSDEPHGDQLPNQMQSHHRLDNHRPRGSLKPESKRERDPGRTLRTSPPKRHPNSTQRSPPSPTSSEHPTNRYPKHHPRQLPQSLEQLPFPVPRSRHHQVESSNRQGHTTRNPSHKPPLDATKPVVLPSQNREHSDRGERPQPDSLTKTTVVTRHLPQNTSRENDDTTGPNQQGEREEKQGENRDKDRYYDRRLGEEAAERRAPKVTKRTESRGSSTAQVAATPMKYYRPGDPNHPSIKPISAGFKRRYGNTLDGIK